MAGFAITNSLETLVYLSTAPLTCAQMMTMGMGWLPKQPAGSQVMEVVYTANPSTTTYTIGSGPAAVGGGEVNMAEGGKSSSGEVTATAGSITLTKTMPRGVQEGKLDITAPFMVSGTFHAEWCEGGSEY
jgi:hypothetical protein